MALLALGGVGGGCLQDKLNATSPGVSSYWPQMMVDDGTV